VTDTTAPFRVISVGDCTVALALLARSPGARIPVQNVNSAQEVISRLEELAPDIVLVDGDASAPLGLEVCRELKQHPATMLLPVVVMAGSSRRRLAALGAGADDFITRQSRQEVLHERVAAVVRAGTTRRQLAAARLSTEMRRHEDMRQTFRRYLSPRLADKILGDAELQKSMLGSADLRTHAVVMFADLRGFTSLTERLAPHEVVPLLNEYFSLLTEITFQHDGTVFHMAGDCLMVGFGVPLVQDDSPERAVRTAQEMLERFADMADDWRERHQIDTGLGIGINEGDVVAGNVGSDAYMNYTIIGDTVNVASRLCQRARAGEMLFSDTIKRSLDAHGFDIEAMALPPMTLRGRSAPIDIFCVPLQTRLHVHSELNAR
jgi:adenylate cyclase